MDLGDFLWSLLVIFFMITFFVIFFQVIIDLFRRHDASGWVKAIWIIFFVFLPFLGVLIYLIVNSSGMAERRAKDVADSQAQFDSYVRSVAPTATPADQIAQAKQLLDQGAITQADFDALKAKALA